VRPLGISFGDLHEAGDGDNRLPVAHELLHQRIDLQLSQKVLLA
jgi:hypothetical protein